MAHNHKKNLVYPPDKNGTQVCYSFCSSNCPHVCLPTLPSIPFFSSHHPPPLPPPPPPPLLGKQSNQHVPILVVVLVAILASAFLLITYFGFIIIIRYWSNWYDSRRLTTPTDDTHEDHDLTQDPIHHIWYVRTVGLEESVINSISLCKYKRGGGLVEGTECSVCLNEFREDEDLRLLPKCSHAFHIPCIDMWLRSHVNCPLCRANVVSIPTNSHSADPISTNSGSEEESLERSYQNHAGLGNSGGTEDVVSQNIIHEDTSDLGDVSTARVNCGFRAQSDLVDNRRSNECAIEMIDDDIQPVRRSVSVDSSASLMIGISLANILQGDSGRCSPIAGDPSTGDEEPKLGESSDPQRIVPKHWCNQSMLRMLGDCSKGPFLQKGHVAMKRSFSSGGKVFLTRYSRSRNSILPL